MQLIHLMQFSINIFALAAYDQRGCGNQQCNFVVVHYDLCWRASDCCPPNVFVGLNQLHMQISYLNT